jgi:RNA polymerase sigma-70 factor, ECF subfamily
LRVDLSNTSDEAYLVKCCSDNDPNAQHLLYNRYVEDMMILCLRYVSDNEDAKEVVMDGFLKFFRNIDGFEYRGEGSLKAWLKQIMINQCLMNLRKRKTIGLSGIEPEIHEDKESTDNVLDHLAAKEILKLLQALPDGYRMVFNLYVFEGLNHREIGEMLGISESTSKSQLHRARTMLKEKLILMG